MKEKFLSLNKPELHTFSPENWKDYKLLDCGDFEKLEQFGNVIIRRPEPQAVWNKVWSENEWKNKAHVTFKQQGSHSGQWIKHSKNIHDRWQMNYSSEELNLTFQLALTSFKHVGIFPEQAFNWEYIYHKIKLIKENQPRFLNLFAYTGGASIAAKAAGADVTHVDSIRQVLNWSRENMELSGLQDIRWVLEDAMKFVKREVRRGKTYHGIILDPPAYGIGANGERWKLEDHINELLKDISQLLDPNQHFLILNVYSLGLSGILIKNLVEQNFDKSIEQTCGELYLQAESGVQLPLGILSRYSFGV